MSDKPRCLETRRWSDGHVRRRYEHRGYRWSTIEVPIDLWRQVNGQGRNRDRAAAVQREIARKQTKATAQALHHQGLRTLAIASELGVPLRTVQRWISAGKP